MLYEFRFIADTPRDAADTLRETADVLEKGYLSDKVVHLSRGPEPNGVAAAKSGGLPLTAEAFARAAEASMRDKDPPPAKPAAAAAVKPAKARPGTATVVDAPDGEPAAVLEESPFANLPPVPAASPDLTPDQQRERAIALLQESFGYKTGPALVRALQTKLGVKKFNEVPDSKCAALLEAAEKIMAQLKPPVVE